LSGARNGETAGKKWFTVQKNVEEIKPLRFMTTLLIEMVGFPESW